MNLVFLDFRGCIVGKVVGDLDVLSADVINARFRLLFRQGRHAMVMDLSEVHYVDSAGIGVLVGINSWLERYDRKLYLYRPTPPVEKLLESMGIDIGDRLIRNLDLVRGDSEETLAEWRSSHPILLVGPKPESRQLVETILREEGFTEIQSCAGTEEAIRCLEQNQPDLVALDLALDPEEAIGFLHLVADAAPDIPVIHTGFEVQNGQVGTNRRQSFLTLVSSGLLGEELNLADLL